MADKLSFRSGEQGLETAIGRRVGYDAYTRARVVTPKRNAVCWILFAQGYTDKNRRTVVMGLITLHYRLRWRATGLKLGGAER